MHLAQISLSRQAHADLMGDRGEAEGGSGVAEGNCLAHRRAAAAAAVDRAEDVGERR